MREYTIAAIPADGIGPEVIAAGLQALEALEQRASDFKLQVEHFDWGSDYYKKHGRMMPEDGLEQLKPFDAIFFGAVGAPDVPDHITLWGLRLPICQGFDQYANVRPTRILPGISVAARRRRPGDLDWVIVRENSEGEYSRATAGARIAGLPEEVGDRGRRSSPASASPASCASPSSWRSRARASTSPSSPNRTPSATAW